MAQREPSGIDVGAARSRDQVARDADVVRRQVQALRQTRRGTAYQQRMAELIADRRAEAGEDVEQFDVVQDGPHGGTPLVRGALLVRAVLAKQAPELYAFLVAEVGAARERLDGRLHVLGGKDVDAGLLVELARTVRSHGFEASVDHIVPLDIICKGAGGPAPTNVGSVGAPSPDGAGVRLAVLDTGVAVKGREHDWHAGLHGGDNDDLLDAFPAPGGDGLLDVAAGHGAFASGVVQQVAPAAQVQVSQAIDSDGIGSEVVVAERLLEAVRRDGAEIVNLSLGAQTVDDQPLLAFQLALELLTEGGHDDVLLVAAAGNYGDSRPCWPAAFRRVVAVAGLTARLRPASWAGRGVWVDVSTVAEGIVSTYVRGKESSLLGPGPGADEWPLADPLPWAVWTGTSFAAPQVAGEVARRLAEARAADPATRPRAVLAAMLAEGRRLPDYGVALQILGGTPARR